MSVIQWCLILCQVDEGMEWVRKAEVALELPRAPDLTQLTQQHLLARCLLYHAIGLVMKAEQAVVYSKAIAYRKQAMLLLHRCVYLTPREI